jgi:acid phosphatase (class A)
MLSGSFVRASAVSVGLLACLVLARVVHPAASDTGDRAATSAYAAEHFTGFLTPAERPDSIALVPPPPVNGTPGYLADIEAYRALYGPRDTARWRLAAEDANLKFPHAASTFACAIGLEIDADSTPALYTLLQRTIVDAGQSTYAAKDKYKRPRPFAVFNEPICVPEDADRLRDSGAYPSGHASLGWTWALILAELVPERSDAIFSRGRAFGDNRVVCGVHWPSDVQAGQTIAAAVVARLHAKPEFMAQMQRAKAELSRAAASPRRPDCALERAALADATY